MSLDSNKVSILAAEKPAKPAAPTTVISGSNVMIDWVAPNANGSPITSYTITIKKLDGTYATEVVGCNGSLSTIVT